MFWLGMLTGIVVWEIGRYIDRAWRRWCFRRRLFNSDKWWK